MLISHGHSWLSIQSYTLNEIGIFLKAVLVKEERDRIGQFSSSWLSTHLNHKGYESHMRDMQKELQLLSSNTVRKPGELTQDELESEWKRFANAISGAR